MRGWPALFVAFVCLSAVDARGVDTSVTLPLDGYFHPGRYMPVRVVGEPPGGKGGAIVVTAQDSVWAAARSDAGEKIDGTMPMMPVGSDPRPVGWYWLNGAYHEAGALRPLTDRQKLVGYTDGVIDPAEAMRVAAEVYPGAECIPHALNAAQPLPGSPACWEALDLVLLDGNVARRIGEQKFSCLVAAGVAFAVRAETPPWPRWPWHKAAEGWWTIRHVPAGPAAATYLPDAYLPVTQFTGGWPAAIRWRYVLYGVAISLAFLLLALFRPRYLAAWAAALTLGTAIPLIVMHEHERPLRMAEGKIRVIGPELTQEDDWAYLTAPQRVFSRNRWVDTLKIVMAEPGMLAQINPRVECVANGDADSLAFDVLPNAKVALLCRRCGPQSPAIAPKPTADSPLQRLAKSAYVSPGDQILGETPTTALITEAYYHVEQWPAVVIRKGK